MNADNVTMKKKYQTYDLEGNIYPPKAVSENLHITLPNASLLYKNEDFSHKVASVGGLIFGEPNVCSFCSKSSTFSKQSQWIIPFFGNNVCFFSFCCDEKTCNAKETAFIYLAKYFIFTPDVGFKSTDVLHSVLSLFDVYGTFQHHNSVK